MQDTFEIQVSNDDFDNLINNCESTKKDTQKKLTTSLLNKYLSTAMAIAEQKTVKLTHLSSTVNLKKIRADTKYLAAHAKCSINTQCKTTYNIVVKERTLIEDKISITIQRNNNHNHDDKNCNIIEHMKLDFMIKLIMTQSLKKKENKFLI